jgi:hypothetical protein
MGANPSPPKAKRAVCRVFQNRVEHGLLRGDSVAIAFKSRWSSRNYNDRDYARRIFFTCNFTCKESVLAILARS